MWDRLYTTLDNNRRDIIVLSMLIVIGVIIFYPMMMRWNTLSDYEVHNGLAASVLENPSEFFSNTPHFLYHVSAAIIYLISPINDINVAAAWVMILSYLGVILILYWQLSREKTFTLSIPHLFWISILVLSLLIITPISVFTPDNMYFGFFASHVYHNPTINIMKPFSLLLFFMTVKIFFNNKPLSSWWILPFGLVTFLSLVAKPSFIIAFIPALALLSIFLISWRIQDLPPIIRRPWYILRAFTNQNNVETENLPRLLQASYVNWVVLIGGIVLPAFFVLLYQTMTWTSAGGIELKAFHVLDLWAYHFEPAANQNLLYKFIMSCAFPLLVYVLHINQTHKNISFNLGWILYFVAAGYYYFFVDLTRADAGDFTWSSQIAALILYYVAAIFLFRNYSKFFDAQQMTISRWGSLVLCSGVFLLHVISGIYWFYLHYTQPVEELLYIWW